MRCWHALQKMSKRPDSRELIKRNPVMRGAGRSGATCPVNGKRCSITPNTNSRISPHRNSGIERSRIETRSVSGSSTVPRTRNIRRPPPMPKIAAITMAAAASWMVAGSAVATSDPESRRNWMERPKSPCRASASQIAYCSGKGRSRPISWRLASISSSVAVGGNDIAAGSTGSARSTQNNSTDTASSIGTAVSRRRAISLPTIPIISLKTTNQSRKSPPGRQLQCNVCANIQPFAYFV